MGRAANSKVGIATDAFERGRRLLVLAGTMIVLGLAVAGSIDRATGGVLLLAGWGLGIAALHRLGRSGAGRSPGRSPSGSSRSD